MAAAASQRRTRARRSGRPGLGIGGAVLAGGGRHAHDALAAVGGGGHHAGGEVGLVVGVGPDGQDRAEPGGGVRRRSSAHHPRAVRRRALPLARLRPPSMVPSGAAMPTPPLPTARLRATVLPGLVDGDAVAGVGDGVVALDDGRADGGELDAVGVVGGGVVAVDHDGTADPITASGRGRRCRRRCCARRSSRTRSGRRCRTGRCRPRCCGGRRRRSLKRDLDAVAAVVGRRHAVELDVVGALDDHADRVGLGVDAIDRASPSSRTGGRRTGTRGPCRG